ncbi:hypothetical protein [Pelomonas aquatica]|uniref:Uncharacterized protein n=1 Tax=Pelomonas aquatica TaxID=431058 RepID=A0A9X4LGF9_9BURK|nr:hypothetical protein [Pelomonas aquatica]MCY4752992.1 hypothetical protein [Pelomonas aquatica]MDG0862067.1 hypothetical protein [Pelomonas aquatica]
MTATNPSCRLTALLAILAWWVMAHPYEGLWHDAVLYFGQTLLHSSAPGLSQDVFFSGGSQDRYSIYAHVMVPLYKHLGRIATHVGVLTGSWLLLIGAMLALLRRFDASEQIHLWGLLAFAVMSPTYGGGNVFRFGEAFVTARSFAEPLLLWSLVALLDGRRLAAVALQLLGLSFHPLMALPVISLSWCYLVETDRQWLWLLATLPAALVAALAGIPPWDGLLRTYDPYWWSLFETSADHLLIGNWSLDEQLTVLLDVAILIAVTRLRPKDAWTRLILAVVITTLAFIGLTILCVDFGRSVMLTQLQLWRAHWVAHLLAMTLTPWLLAKLWQLDGLWRASACALGLALMNSHFGMDHGKVTLPLWGLASLAAWRVRKPSRTVVWLACPCILLCTLGLIAYQLDAMLQQQGWQFPTAGWNDRFIEVAAIPVVAFAGFAALLRVCSKSRVGVWLALSLSALLLFTALTHWDQRSDLARTIESPSAHEHPFIAHLPAKASVYWPNQLAPVWGLLGHPSHFSQQQGAGVLFNRDTALIYGPRREAYRLIDEDRKSCRTGALMARDHVALAGCDMPSQGRLETLCQQADAPDFMALRGRLKPEPLATWQPPQRRDSPQTFALYACSQLTSKEP